MAWCQSVWQFNCSIGDKCFFCCDKDLPMFLMGHGTPQIHFKDVKMYWLHIAENSNMTHKFYQYVEIFYFLHLS